MQGRHHGVFGEYGERASCERARSKHESAIAELLCKKAAMLREINLELRRERGALRAANRRLVRLHAKEALHGEASG